MGRTASARNLVLSTTTNRYAYSGADPATWEKRRRPAIGAFATTLAVTVGLLDLACVVLASAGTTLIEDNVIAQAAIMRHGPEIVASYSWTTLTVGLLLVAMGLRSAAASAREHTGSVGSRAYLQAALSGLNAAGIALLAWWTAWIFI
jgi:hypothetical protein